MDRTLGFKARRLQARNLFFRPSAAASSMLGAARSFGVALFFKCDANDLSKNLHLEWHPSSGTRSCGRQQFEQMLASSAELCIHRVYQPGML